MVNDKLRVAFVSSEMTPYASTGGLADVCGSLPKALGQRGIETVSFMPLYRRVMEGSYPIEDTGIRISIPVGFHHYVADIWKTTSSDPVVYFIRRDEFFDRSQLYNLTDRDYDDNFERFIFFQKAVTALIDHLDTPFDIVHAHDWQTGLLPLYLKHGMSGEGRANKEKCVFTIHNLAYQGVFSGDEYSYTNLPFSCFSVEYLEFYGNVNCLKGGIVTSDLITTVSKTYADEIKTEEWGCGLHGVLESLNNKLTGIANGIDDESWNPGTDKHIVAHYTANDISNKSLCRTDLVQRMKLTVSDDDPILGFITRLTNQKGVELIDQVLPRLMKETTAALVLLGSGSDAQEDLVRSWPQKWPGRVVVKTGFDQKLARRIMAGSDIYLMPSKFEPCGLNQLYSIRYGTIPVVHAVGGLEDTILDVIDNPEQGYGFKFSNYRAFAFYEAIENALKYREDPINWTNLIKRAMQQDFSWDVSAQEYEALYKSILSQPAS